MLDPVVLIGGLLGGGAHRHRCLIGLRTVLFELEILHPSVVASKDQCSMKSNVFMQVQVLRSVIY